MGYVEVGCSILPTGIKYLVGDMPIEAVIFDMDGVLIDSFDAWYHTENLIFQKYCGRSLTKEEYGKDFWGKDTAETCKLIGLSAKETEKVIEWQDTEILKHLEKIKAFPSSKNILKSLKESGLKLGLLSNNRKSLITIILKKFGLEEFFDAVVGDEVEPKPSPDGLLKIAAILKIDKDKTLFIGDTETDSKAGKAAEIKTIIIRKDIRILDELPGFVN